ncbi:MAG TPA: DNA-deoxyinosine glycosylase [Feifaniaceae bacterium]|nr:DNA-deoxyinosine glycosylase [Feifaniaceae bacterium]
MRSVSLPPAENADAKLLILGSMPGVRSLEAGQYYAHPRNDFWPLLFAVLRENDPVSYDARIAALLKNKIALWDVIYECEREGSLDKNIKAAVPNDIRGFLKKHPSIKTVCFNGTAARRTYFAHFEAQEDISYLLLPSSSPVPRRHIRTREDKLPQWLEIRKYL